MANNDQNLYHLNPRFHQHNNSSLINMFKPTNNNEEIRGKHEKIKIEEKMDILEKQLHMQKEINQKLIQKINELEVIITKTSLNKNGKDHQRVFSQSRLSHSASLSGLTSQAIINSFVLNYPEIKNKKAPIYTHFIEDLQKESHEKKLSQELKSKDSSKRLHHQKSKSNSFNTKSLVIVETQNNLNSQQKSDFTTIHVNFHDVSIKPTPPEGSRHLFQQKKINANTNLKKNNTPLTETSTNNCSANNISGFSSNLSVIHEVKKKTDQMDKDKDLSSFSEHSLEIQQTKRKKEGNDREQREKDQSSFSEQSLDLPSLSKKKKNEKEQREKEKDLSSFSEKSTDMPYLSKKNKNSQRDHRDHKERDIDKTKEKLLEISKENEKEEKHRKKDKDKDKNKEKDKEKEINLSSFSEKSDLPCVSVVYQARKTMEIKTDVKLEVKDQKESSFSEKSFGLPCSSSEPESGINLQKSNVANCHVLLSPKERMLLCKMGKGQKRKWTCGKGEEKSSGEEETHCQKIEYSPNPYLIKSKTDSNFFKSNYSKTHLCHQDTEGLATITKKYMDPKLSLKGHFDGVRDLFFNENGVLVSGGEDKTIKLWDLKEFGRGEGGVVEEYYTIREHMGVIFSITGNKDFSKKNILGGMLFSSDSKGVINAFNLPNHEYIKKNGISNEENFKIGSWKAHDDAIWKIYFRGQDEFLFSSGSDGKTKKWKLFDNSYTSIYQPKTINEFSYKYANGDYYIPTSFCVMNNIKDEVAISYSFFDKILIYDENLHGNKPKQTCFIGCGSPFNQINRLIYNNENNLLIAACEDKKIKCIDTRANKLFHEFIAHNDSISALDMKDKSFFLASGGHDGSLRIWDLRNYKCIQEIAAHRRKYDESIHTVVYNENHDYLASGGADSLIKIFKVLQ